MRFATALLSFILPALAICDAAAQDATAPKVVVTPLASKTQTATGQPILLPQKNVQVVVSSFEIPVGAKLPVHKHPFARYAYVEAGTLEVTAVESGKSNVYKAGDFIVEMIDQWHRAANIGSDAVKLIVIDQIEAGAQNTILQQ
ncbi:MAG: cupin domain-containing protein [Rhizobiaceae bacterium]|nr:cupin domain-containing protein [Rhizobiaceae bacterium]